ncbi:MAG: RHS repeat-associated core domain-containing protein [Planctomycetia bacterium]
MTSADHSVQSDETYTYDANGNRTNTGYVVDAANRLTSDGTYNYTYDAEGNLTTKTEIATGNVTEYTYDHRNRLVLVQEKSSGGIILNEVEYTYDALDRRIAKTVDADGEGPQAAETTHFAYDGEHIWADFDNSGVITARYLYGNSIDQLIARYRPVEGTAWYLTDHLGTVRDIVNAAGTLINHIDYDSFGNILAQTDPAAGDRFTYTGREFDAETGLYYYRARYYDPITGRFISEDPISFAAGDANLYRYVGNSPLMAIDPSGQATVMEYMHTLGSGPAGALMLSARFNCYVREITAWAISRSVISAVTGEETPIGHNDVATIGLGVVACTMFPASAMAQSAFLLVSETLYLYSTGASATDIVITALTHTLGIAGGSGLSKYRSKVQGFLADEAGCLRLARGKKGFRRAVDELGLDKNKASNNLHKIKKQAGRGGADNVDFNLDNGDVIAPETGEVIGNLIDG